MRISGKTALQFASHQGHVETIKMLLKFGSNTQMKVQYNVHGFISS